MCRTYNGFDINFNEDYFLNKVLLPTLETGELPLDQLWSGNQKDGRGNIAPNTIVMPFYAMEAKKKAERAGHPEYIMDYFLDILDTAISNCRDELIVSIGLLHNLSQFQNICIAKTIQCLVGTKKKVCVP